MTRLTAEERQKLGAKRRELKKQSGVVEELRQVDGMWKIYFLRGKTTVDVIDLK